MGKSIHDNISNSEETATAAETEIRTRTPGHVSMYWNLDKHSISGKETRDHDRAVMRSNGAVKEGDNATGKKAVKMMNENYPKTQVQSKKVGKVSQVLKNLNNLNPPQNLLQQVHLLSQYNLLVAKQQVHLSLNQHLLKNHITMKIQTLN